MATRNIIEIKDLTKVYDLGAIQVPALRGINFVIEEGTYTAIMGPSGSGKSTLLNILGCLDRPTEGAYILGDEDVAHMNDRELSRIRGARIGFIFQSYNLVQQLNVVENIHVPLFYQGKDIREYYDHCVKLADKVGLADRLDHRPMQLSGGQQQRVAVARALANEPLMLLADEPTGNLDSTTEEEILDILDELHGEGRTLVVVTHDDAVAERAERVIHLKDGLIDRDILGGNGKPKKQPKPAKPEEPEKAEDLREDAPEEIKEEPSREKQEEKPEEKKAVDLPPLPGEDEKPDEEPRPAIITSIKLDEADLPPLPVDLDKNQLQEDEDKDEPFRIKLKLKDKLDDGEETPKDKED